MTRRGLRTLHQAGHTEAARTISSMLEQTGLQNVFNPSAVQHRGGWLVAFRAFGEIARTPFGAWLSSDQGEACIDLTAHAQSFGLSVVADPKLFRLGDEVWVTFNSGTPDAGPNEVHVMSVAPTLGSPIRCVVEPRARIEKNWAFGGTQERPWVVYGLEPLTLLELAARSTGEWHFRPRVGRTGDVDVKASLSLGSPLVEYSGGLIGVAHERRLAGRRRAYFGRPVSISTEGSVEVGVARLVHSLTSIMGTRPKHNVNLLSCTYFAGLDVVGDEAVLSYGINDVDFGIAQLRVDELW